MTHRHIFRMMHYQNLDRILTDRAIHAKNFTLQPGYQISYDAIVNKRGSSFLTPSGLPINDFVPFYFSPATAMAYTISNRNVPLRDPNGATIGQANLPDVAFVVSHTSHFVNAHNEYWFTDTACNAAASPPVYENDLSKLSTHIDWSLFDEDPKMASIPEIGYNGVCRYFLDKDTPSRYSNRSKKRMAEFLVKDAVPVEFVDCIVVRTEAIRQSVAGWVGMNNLQIPVYVKPGCYF